MGKTCLSCFHYGSVSTKDVLNSDKTVTKAKLQYEFCRLGNFYLTDHNHCEFYREIREGEKRSARIIPPPLSKNSDDYEILNETKRKHDEVKDKLEIALKTIKEQEKQIKQYEKGLNLISRGANPIPTAVQYLKGIN
jgi:hypothetical protein